MSPFGIELTAAATSDTVAGIQPKVGVKCCTAFNYAVVLLVILGRLGDAICGDDIAHLLGIGCARPRYKVSFLHECRNEEHLERFSKLIKEDICGIAQMQYTP